MDKAKYKFMYISKNIKWRQVQKQIAVQMVKHTNVRQFKFVDGN